MASAAGIQALYDARDDELMRRRRSCKAMVQRRPEFVRRPGYRVFLRH